jgi:hypothetical protein
MGRKYQTFLIFLSNHLQFLKKYVSKAFKISELYLFKMTKLHQEIRKVLYKAQYLKTAPFMEKRMAQQFLLQMLTLLSQTQPSVNIRLMMVELSITIVILKIKVAFLKFRTLLLKRILLQGRVVLWPTTYFHL